MKRTLLITVAVLGMLCLAGRLFKIAAHSASNEKNAFTPETIPWGPPPPFILPGAQLAVIEGNPGASTGDYTVRLKMPDGYRIAPHWHPSRENVTVISGTFKVGMGDTFDTNKMGSFPAGSFAYLDPDMHHYAMIGPEEVDRAVNMVAMLNPSTIVSGGSARSCFRASGPSPVMSLLLANATPISSAEGCPFLLWCRPGEPKPDRPPPD